MSRLLLVLLIFSVNLSWAQSPARDSEVVQYRIEVNLDDVRHTLRGRVAVRYVNASNDPLSELHIHLYPNAYRHRNTAYARQTLSRGETEFHFSEPWERGGIDSLDFTVNGAASAWRLDAEHPDIAYVTLPEPLLPGERIEVATPFRVRIPRSFSRLGRVGQSYQITQWFPKLARYAEGRWHSMPYLDQGEFYSDFGSYDVTIALPDNYLVAATGRLQTASERQWLDALASDDSRPLPAFPPSSGRMKVLRYKASLVHDFAWFADKRFAVRQDTAEIAGRTITCQAFFTDMDAELWENAVQYLKDALRFYARHVGAYPYDHMTAVQSPLSKGGGMEYPMITLIGKERSPYTLDQVISHEVGHNWFYGILASNERDHHWMDEGINTYYEYRYFAEKYGRFGSSFLPRLSRRPVRLTDAQRFLQYLHQRNRLQSPTHSSGDLTPVNYVLNAYEKTAFAFRLLEGYLGRDSFDHAMQTYFHTWQFRHPGPEDLRGVLESACICDLSWLFDGLLGTALLPDYAIADITNDSLYLVNLGQLTPPVQVLALRGDTVVREFWIDGFHGRRAIATDLVHADRWQLYADEVSLDGRPDDNQILANGRRGKQTRLSWIGDVADPGSNHLNISVIPGWNKTDGGMLGLAVSNLHWPPRNLLWMAAPYYATGSESLTGLGEIRYRLPGGSYRKHWELGLAGKSFHYDRDTAYGFRDRYLKLAGSLQLTLKPADRFDTRTRYIRYRGVLVQQSYGRGIDFAQRLWSRERRHYWVNELRFLSEHPDPLAPNTLEIRFTQGKGFVRLTADIDQSFIYARGNKGIHLHGFAGWLPHRDAPLANVNFYFNGTSSNGFFSKDYLYDEILLARNARSGIWSQQVFAKDARLKTLYTGGVSDRWMVGAGLAVDPPWPIPVRPYLDFAVSPDLFDGKAQLNYSGGLALVLIPEVLEVYAPIIESREIRESLTYQTRKSLVQRMSFVINFKALHPFDLFTKF